MDLFNLFLLINIMIDIALMVIGILIFCWAKRMAGRDWEERKDENLK
jgi:hypothetical protein